MSLLSRLPREKYLCRSSSNVPCLPSFLQLLQNPHVLLTFGRVQNPLRLPDKTTLQRPKVAQTCGVFSILTWKFVSRHHGVHFFNISTSTNIPRTVCFVHFDFKICFVPQQRALLEHLNFQVIRESRALCILTSTCASRHNSVHFFSINFQKCSNNDVLCTF